MVNKSFWFLLFCLQSVPCWSMLYSEVNMEQMITEADWIVQATLKEKHTGVDSNIAFVSYTFSVDKWYSGGTGQQEFTIKQLGKTKPDQSVVLFEGLPQFTQGQSYVLFLPEPSAQGFASPIYLLMFEVRQEKSSQTKRVMPHRKAKGLFNNIQSVPMQTLIQRQDLQKTYGSESSISLDALEQMINEGRTP